MSDDRARPRIAVVGPVSPYRGGISQYTESLASALADVADVSVFSFSKQYPRLLYPGDTDVDPTRGRLAHAQYVLSATSPWSWWRTVDRIIAAQPDLVVVDWWTLFWQPWSAYLARRLRRRGIRVVFLCHNLVDHDAGGLRTRLTRGMLRAADGYVVHGSAMRADLERLVPGATVLQRPHPVYDRFPEPAHRWAPRARLDLLFFGFIRPYKGLDTLLDAMALLDDDDVALSVVGEAWGEGQDALRARIESLGAEAVLHYVDDHAAADYFARADLVVLPYRSATGSGVVSAAYHYLTPVLATRVGGIPDVVDDTTGFLVPPDDPGALAQAIRGITREACRALQPGIGDFAQRNSWRGFARAIVDEFVGGPRLSPGSEQALG
ncbi:glycosyltransferase [Microbacterium awajiense]|uniref:Glycosyltransferase n=1 Tax=Microbacterium awajiense TaxID=415214 RepID=A0ABP7ADS3_9MICO